MYAPILGTVEVPRLTELSQDVARRGRVLLDVSRTAYLAGLGVVATARAETARAVEGIAERTQSTVDTLVARGETVEDARAVKVAELRADVDARRDAAARRIDDAVVRHVRHVRDVTSAAVRRVGMPSRDEVQALAASVAELSGKVDALVARLAAVPVVAPEPTVTVTATEDGWAVQVEGTATVLATHPTKEEAVDAARALAAERAPSHLVVYKKDGTIGDKSSYHV